MMQGLTSFGDSYIIVNLCNKTDCKCQLEIDILELSIRKCALVFVLSYKTLNLRFSNSLIIKMYREKCCKTNKDDYSFL